MRDGEKEKKRKQEKEKKRKEQENLHSPIIRCLGEENHHIQSRYVCVYMHIGKTNAVQEH